MESDKQVKKPNQLTIQQLLTATALCLSLSTTSYAQQEQEQSANIPTDTDAHYTQENQLEPQTEAWIEPQPDQAAMAAAEAAAQAMVPIVDAYKQCVTAVIASNSPVDVKSEEITTECQSQRQAIAETLPEDIHEFMLLNMDRRVNMVLQAMKDAEGAVDDTAQDIAEAVNELATEDENPAK